MATKREAIRLGRARGLAAASWVFDGNTTAYTYEAAKRGIDDGDPEVLDRLCPPNWLSGEWSGESIPEIFGDSRVSDAAMEAYCEAADAAYWAEVEQIVSFYWLTSGTR